MQDSLKEKGIDISKLRLLYELTDAFVCGLWIVSIPYFAVAAIIAWPLAILLAIMQFLIYIICLPLTLLVLVPLGQWLAKNDRDNPVLWASLFFLSGASYVLLISMMTDFNNAASGLALICLVCALAGFMLCVKLFHDRRQPPS